MQKQHASMTISKSRHSSSSNHVSSQECVICRNLSSSSNSNNQTTNQNNYSSQNNNRSDSINSTKSSSSSRGISIRGESLEGFTGKKLSLNSERMKKSIKQQSNLALQREAYFSHSDVTSPGAALKNQNNLNSYSQNVAKQNKLFEVLHARMQTDHIQTQYCAFNQTIITPSPRQQIRQLRISPSHQIQSTPLTLQVVPDGSSLSQQPRAPSSFFVETTPISPLHANKHSLPQSLKPKFAASSINFSKRGSTAPSVDTVSASNFVTDPKEKQTIRNIEPSKTFYEYQSPSQPQIPPTVDVAESQLMPTSPIKNSSKHVLHYERLIKSLHNSSEKNQYHKTQLSSQPTSLIQINTTNSTPDGVKVNSNDMAPNQQNIQEFSINSEFKRLQQNENISLITSPLASSNQYIQRKPMSILSKVRSEVNSFRVWKGHEVQKDFLILPPTRRNANPSQELPYFPSPNINSMKKIIHFKDTNLQQNLKSKKKMTNNTADTSSSNASVGGVSNDPIENYLSSSSLVVNKFTISSRK